MKRLFSIRTVIALMLTLITVYLIPAQTAFAAENGKYVSEVYVAYGKNAEEAKKTLEDKGFTPVEGNLNDGGSTYSMLGYKTTNEIRDSITDLAVMNMNGNFSVEDYKNLLKKQKAEIAEFLGEFMAVIKEYRANLKAGKKKATYVHDLLNNYIDDDTGMKMGDLLASETLQDKLGIAKSIEDENPDKLPDLVTILMQGNAQVIKSMEFLLSMATDTAENTWLDRFAESDFDTMLDEVQDERPDLNTESKRIQYLENIYGEAAGVLGLETAALCDSLNDYVAMGLTVETATKEDIRNTFGDIENNPDAISQYEKWLTVGLIYEGLKNYEGGNYAAGELLDFFMEENDPEDTEIFIPMAAALSEGQRYGLPFVRFEQLLKFAFTTEEGWEEAANKGKASIDGLQDVSVYQNIDRDVYKEDGSVAMTDSAQRAKNTSTGTTGTQQEQMDTLGLITAIGWVASVISIAATFKIISAKNALLNSDIILDLDSYGTKALYGNSYDLHVFSTRFNVSPETIHTVRSARLAMRLARVMVVVSLAISIATFVLTIVELARDDSVEQLPIPNYMVDNYTDLDGGSYTLNYKAVECNRMEFFGANYTKQKGNSADLNADEGKQWLVLYASKNSKAGKPLTPDFVIQKSNQAPSGYNGRVHLFGEKGAVNVVSGAFKNYSSLSRAYQDNKGEYTMYIFTKLSKETKTYDEASGNMTASAISGSKAALFGIGGLAIGAILGAVCTLLVNKSKKKKELAS